MRRAGGLYSRMIRLAQVLLPLTALFILATLFLIARAPSQEGEIPYADVEAIARENRLTRPSYSGTTESGETVTARAKLAAPDADAAIAQQITARIETPSGESVDISAGAGRFEPEDGKVRFSELVRIHASTGYQIETGSLVLTPETGHAASEGAVAIRAPFGRIDAGRFELSPGAGTQPQTLLFLDGVHLIYTPQDPAP